MSDYSAIFQLVSNLMRKEHVFCILIGGFAVNFYKVSRNTADVDFLITKEDFYKILEFLVKNGFEQLSSHENFAHFKNTGIGLTGIDFMFVDKETFIKIEREGQKLKIGKNEFIVPSLSHLIALKLHSMKSNFKDRFGKDFPDIIALIRTNHLNVNDDQFKQLCLKFGSQEIYQKIMEAM